MVEVHYQGAGLQGQARISDISSHGIFIDTVSPAPPGEQLRVSFELPGGEQVDAEGQVKYAQQSVGMGIEFTRIEAEAVRRIAEFVESTA